MEYTEYLECFCKYVKNFMANISRFYSNQVAYPYPTYSNQAPNTTSKRGNESGLLPVGKIRVRDGKWFDTYEPLEMRKHKGILGNILVDMNAGMEFRASSNRKPHWHGASHTTNSRIQFTTTTQGMKHYTNKTKDTIYNNKKYGEAPQQRKYDTFYKLSLLFFLLHRLPSSGRRAKFISGSLA